MIIVANRNKRINSSSSAKIINTAAADLTPRVMSKKTIKDQFGNSDTLLTINFYCQVDATKLKTLSNYEKIELKLSKNNLNYYANIANSSSAKTTAQRQIKSSRPNSFPLLTNQSNSPTNRANSPSANTPTKLSGGTITHNNNLASVVATSNKKKNSLTVRQLKNSLGKANLFRQNKNANIYKNTTSIGFINLSTAKKMSTTEKILEITENIDELQHARAISLELGERRSNLRVTNKRSSNKVENPVDLSKVFQKFYLMSMEENKDPIVLFQESFKKSSHNQKRKGLTEKTGKKYNKNFDLFLEMHRNISSTILGLSTIGYEFQEKTVNKDFLTLPLSVNINLSTLKSFGNEFYVLMFGKSNTGQKIESSEYLVDISDIEMQLNTSSSEYSVSTSRTGTGISVLKTTNKNKKGKVNLFVEAKTIKRQLPNNFSYFNEISNFSVGPKNEFLLRDGRLRSRGKNPIFFNACDTIFYRTLLGFREKKYFNCKSAVDANPRGFQENLPFCSLIAKNPQPKGREGISIQISNISNNVVAVRPKKFKFVGNSKGKITSLKDSNGKDIKFNYVTKNGSTSKFFDRDVKEKSHYMYVVECLMNNGERKFAPANFVIRYEKRTGTVAVNNIKLTSENPVVDESNSLNSKEKENFNQRKVNITFRIERVLREVDKILENMFGNLFDLFQDKLKTIRDVQSLVYSVEIIRVNNFTGAAETIGKVTPDEKGLCSFTDTTAPLFESCTYQFLPRVMLASEAIEEVNSQIEVLSKRLKRSPINYARASRRAKSYKKKNRIMSIQKAKFNRKRAFTKSIIEKQKVVVDRQNFDVFLDSTTGDVFEKRLEGFSPQTVPGDVFEVKNASVKKVINEFQNLSSEPTSSKNILNSEHYDISFQVGGDIFVDFYAIYVKEGKDVYLDGAMHSSDGLTSKKYSYLVSHTGSKGIIEYYAIPFYKNGTVGAPKIITAQLL